MIKKYFSIDIISFIIIITLMSVIKFSFGLETTVLSNNLYNGLIYFGDNKLYEFIWFAPIIYMTFIATKNTYYRFFNFDTRFINRKKYFFFCIKNFVICSILYSLLSVLLTLIAIFMKSPNTIIDFDTLFVIIKYVFEMLIFELLVLTVTIYMQNYIYAYLISLLLLFILLNICKISFIPVVTLFLDINLSFVSPIFLIFLFLISYIKYKKIDLGLGGYNS